MKKLMLVTALLSVSLPVLSADLTTYAIEDESNDIVTFENGIVLKLDGKSYKGGYTGYIGHISYHEEAIFAGDKVCLKGKSYFYDMYDAGSRSHYSDDNYNGAEAYEKVEEICGSLDVLN